MLIRSQDKKQLINLDNVQSLTISGYRVDDKQVYEDNDNATVWYVSCLFQDYSPFVGHYSTEKSAIKVLDMICEQFRQYTCRYGGNHSDDAVFQMPTEEEVDEPNAQDIIEDIMKM